MRVLLINKFHYLKGGAERAYFDTAHILAENGHEVAFFAMAHPENLETPWSRFFVSPVDYHDESSGLLVKFRMALRILWNFEAAKKLDCLIQQFHPEVAHLHNIYHQLSPSILWTLHRHRVRIIMTLHDYKLISPSYSLLVRGKIWDHTSGWRAIRDRVVMDSYARSIICACEQWVHQIMRSFRLVDAFLAPSQFLIDKFQSVGFPYPIQKVVQPLFPFPAPPAGVSGEYFLFLGRLSREKGVESLIEAMRLWSGQNLIKIVGNGPEENALKKLAQGVPNIVFTPHVTGLEWEETIRGAKALIVPSVWYENMPYVILEALSRGKPVIASRIGGMPERITDGKNGFLFEAGNTGGLLAAIKRFNTSDRFMLSEAAYKSVLDARPEEYYHALLAVYQK